MFSVQPILTLLVLLSFLPALVAGESSPKPALWSIQPLSRAQLPASPLAEEWARNPIDLFIAAKLQAAGLRPSEPADRRTLIRRAFFDLIGLPPAPEEVEAFLADNDPFAYQRLIDQLLASPQYGERWARHWLDVVHYGETHGYDKDKPRPNAWPYRDYVIRAFNSDKPYSRFLQEQIAGDILFPHTVDGIEALGFISAGPWDFIGHEEVPESKMDGKIARHLDRDDMVMNTMQTFNSLTVQCAQCHNHKFDPVSQEDYYSLQAVFAALDRTNKKYDSDPAVSRLRAELLSARSTAISRQNTLNQRIAARAGEDLHGLEKQIDAAEKSKVSSEAFGYHSNIEKQQHTTKWVQLDLGREVLLRQLSLHPCKDDFNTIGEGFGFPLRFKIETSSAPDFSSPKVIADLTGEDQPNPRLQVQSFAAPSHPVRFIRITATRLAPRQDDFIFALAEVQAISVDGHNAALGAEVTALDSIEAPIRWRKQNLTDGWYPGLDPKRTPALLALRQKRAELLAQNTTDQERRESESLGAQISTLDSQLSALPSQRVAYVAAVHHGAGSFRGTGPDGGKPRPIYLLNRGNVQSPGRLVPPGALSCLPNLPARFDLPEDHSEADRRGALAQWLSSPGNPLTWRSIVNRVWQYHFGRGLVDTPNDFGAMGETPSHPELLDWLAVEFRDSGQSLKTLHKLIMLSATYCQSSGAQPEFERVDAGNRLLWRFNRRKVEAEVVRDSILALAGKLDLSMGGPGFQDFVIDKPEHSPHYEYHLHNPEDLASHRRSIYRFIVRSQQQPFMTTLDCADPSMQVGKRNESVSALQALALLNNTFVLSMSKHFAARIGALDASPEAKVARAFYLALGRPPEAAELRQLRGYAAEHGFPNLCRLLFNLNEFSFVD